MNKHIFNRYVSAIILTSLTAAEIEAQTLQPAPRLVVNIVIDQLRTDLLEHYSPLYSEYGFKKLLNEGRAYEAASYPFEPLDKASALTAVATGTTPYYNHIPGEQWLDRTSLRPVFCIDDSKFFASPAHIATSTISDELKVSSNGKAIVFGIAESADAAILSAGHAADAAFWLDGKTSQWITSEYYSQEAKKWLKFYRNTNSQVIKNKDDRNDFVCHFALDCIGDNAMGRDHITDYLAITLSAKAGSKTRWQDELEDTYMMLDRTLANFISSVEQRFGKEQVLFVLTSTGYTDEAAIDYERFHIPTGTFYINRTANLLNMYLAAVYGRGQYVQTCFHNQIYLDHKLIEHSQLNFNEITARSKEFLLQNAGVREVKESPYSPEISGDLIVEVAPGWQLINEDTNESYSCRAAFLPFPIIFYGAGVKAGLVSTPVTTDRIAPTIAKSIRIRAPNACKQTPLF